MQFTIYGYNQSENPFTIGNISVADGATKSTIIAAARQALKTCSSPVLNALADRVTYQVKNGHVHVMDLIATKYTDTDLSDPLLNTYRIA